MNIQEWNEMVLEDSFNGVWVGDKFPKPFEDIQIKQNGDMFTGYIDLDSMFCADDELLNDYNGYLKADDGEVIYWSYIIDDY